MIHLLGMKGREDAPDPDTILVEHIVRKAIHKPEERQAV
jgi:hypothetical protein